MAAAGALVACNPESEVDSAGIDSAVESEDEVTTTVELDPVATATTATDDVEEGVPTAEDAEEGATTTAEDADEDATTTAEDAEEDVTTTASADVEQGTSTASAPVGLGGEHAEILENAPTVIAEISATLTTDVLDPIDADCSYLDPEDDAATRLNNWRIGRDDYLGIPHDVTLDQRLEQRTLVQIASDYGYTEETLVAAIEIYHTECHNRAFQAGDLTEQQASMRATSSIANFQELMNSVPTEDGRGAGPGTRGQD